MCTSAFVSLSGYKVLEAASRFQAGIADVRHS